MSYRLLTYRAADGERAAALIGDRVHDVATLTGNSAHVSMLDVLKDWDAIDGIIAGIAEKGAPAGGLPSSDIALLAPLPLPGQIWGAGANYQDHISEMGDSEYKAVNAKSVSGGRAWHFTKSTRSVIGPASICPLPHYSQKVDWEIELAVVIGRTASRVKAADALNYVAGYTIANDLSARDFVAREGIDAASPFRYDWLSHKGFDGACPMGPWIVPARYIADPHKLDLKLWVDDELMQDSNTRYMIFDIGEQIEEISARITMYPGDVILTGTPSGVGMSRGIYLQSGQHIRLQIEGIGELAHGFS